MNVNKEIVILKIKKSCNRVQTVFTELAYEIEL